MNTSLKHLATLLLASGGLLLAQPLSTPTPEQPAIDLVRGIINVDRVATVANELQLTEMEAEKFWPLYEQYRTEMNRVGDDLVKLVQSYAFHYPNVPEDRAQDMLKKLSSLEKQQVATRTTFLKKFSKFLPHSKTLRFAQVENRLDLALRLAESAKRWCSKSPQ